MKKIGFAMIAMMLTASIASAGTVVAADKDKHSDKKEITVNKPKDRDKGIHATDKSYKKPDKSHDKGYKATPDKKNHESKDFKGTKHHTKRPAIGEKYTFRPSNGRYIYKNRTRYWEANGVIYKILKTRKGIIYQVVAYR